jgi:hypothetical protein
MLVNTQALSQLMGTYIVGGGQPIGRAVAAEVGG